MIRRNLLFLVHVSFLCFHVSVLQLETVVSLKTNMIESTCLAWELNTLPVGFQSPQIWLICSAKKGGSGQGLLAGH